MLLAWKAQGIITLAGYILGFPADTPQTIRRDIAIIQKELPLDILEFFCLTPLPGSEDHQVLWNKGVAMEADLNKYDVEHVCAAHPKMSKHEWEAIYREAWSLYYTPEHMKTLLRRTAATGGPDGQPGQGAGRVRDDGSPGKRAPAPGGHPASEASLRASTRHAARASLDFLAAFRRANDK